MVFESDQFVLSKNGVFVAKGYMCEGLFKLNVTVDSVFNVVNYSAYLSDSLYLWHSRLGHVNFASLRRLMNLGDIPKLPANVEHKCEICVESKFKRKSFQSIQRSTEILVLIHTNLCDLKGIQIRVGKNILSPL